MPEDQRRNDLGAIDDTAQIHPQRAIPRVEIRVVRIPTATAPRVVAKDVNLTECMDGVLGCPAHLIAVADVSLDEMNVFAASGRDPGFLQVASVEVDDDDFHAELQE